MTIFDEQLQIFKIRETLVTRALRDYMKLDKTNVTITKPQFTDNDGQKRIGKTVSIDLAANKGNQELIGLLQSAIEILQADNSAQDNK